MQPAPILLNTYTLSGATRNHHPDSRYQNQLAVWQLIPSPHALEVNMIDILYNGNSPWKKTFTKFVNLEAIVNIFSHFFSPGISQLKMVIPRVICIKFLLD